MFGNVVVGSIVIEGNGLFFYTLLACHHAIIVSRKFESVFEQSVLILRSLCPSYIIHVISLLYTAYNVKLNNVL